MTTELRLTAPGVEQLHVTYDHAYDRETGYHGSGNVHLKNSETCRFTVAFNGFRYVDSHCVSHTVG